MNAALGQSLAHIQRYSSTTIPATFNKQSNNLLIGNNNIANQLTSNSSSSASSISSQFAIPTQHNQQVLNYHQPQQQMKGVGGTGQQQQQQQEMALNLSRQPHPTQMAKTIAQQPQQQQPLLESLMHSVPNATSTPNPIQQQQQHINQDIFTNLFLKFDPTQFLVPKKDQLQFIFNNSGNAVGVSGATVAGGVGQSGPGAPNTVIQFVQPVSQGKSGQQGSHQTAAGTFVQAQQLQQPHFQIVQQQQHPNMQTAQLQQQQQIYIQQQQQQHIYQQQQQPQHQQQQQQFNGVRGGSMQGQMLTAQSATGMSTNSSNIKAMHQQQQQQQQQDEDSNSSDDANSTLGGNPHEKPYKCSQCFKLFRKKVMIIIKLI